MTSCFGYFLSYRWSQSRPYYENKKCNSTILNLNRKYTIDNFISMHARLRAGNLPYNVLTTPQPKTLSNQVPIYHFIALRASAITGASDRREATIAVIVLNKINVHRPQDGKIERTWEVRSGNHWSSITAKSRWSSARRAFRRDRPNKRWMT